MSMGGWDGFAAQGFSGVPPEYRDAVEQLMEEGPDEPQHDLEPLSQHDYDRRRFTMGQFLRPHWVKMLWLFGLVALEATLAQAGPLLLQLAIDNGVVPGNRSYIWTTGTLFIGLVVVATIVGIVRTAASGRVGSTLMAELRVRLFTHFQRLSVDFYTHERAGRLMSRMTSDLESLQQLFSMGLVQLAVQFVTLVAITTVLLVMNPLLAGITLLCVVPTTLAASLWYRKVISDANLVVRDRLADMLAHLQESVTGVRVIAAANRRRRTVVEHENLAGTYRDANDRTADLNGVYGPGVETLGPISQLILLVVGGYLVNQGSVTIGELVAFVLYVGAFFGPIQELVGLYNMYQQGVASVVKLDEILRTEPSVTESPLAHDLPEVQGRIAFEHVDFAYRDGGLVLIDIDFELEPGEVVAIVGPTGAGKSTIAKLLTRFYDPIGGTVKIDGHDVRDVTIGSLRQQVGVVPQEPFLFGGSIRENLLLGRTDRSEADLRAACNAVGLDRLLDRLPDGLDAPCHERGVSMSTGERQLMALARAFLHRPRVLVLDEATSSLDLRTETAVERALDVVLEGRTAVIIAHRLQTTMRADRVLVVEDGRVVEQGLRDDLLAADGRFSAMWAAAQEAGVR
jgi:ATP-binding cassette, subfamily B, bacterial